jgi:alpha-beta hydrolase superfamily lysophospholipase
MKYTEDSFVRDGGRLFYRRWTPDGAPKARLVLAHGFGEHGGRFSNLVRGLLNAGFDTWAMDNRGHGRSFGRRGHIMRWGDYREDLGAFLTLVRREPGELPFFLTGHSMGGLIVIDSVLEDPREYTGVVLSGPALTQGAVSPVLIQISRVLSRLWPSFSVNTKMDAQAISRDPAVVTAYLNDPFVHSLASARMGTEMAKVIARSMENARHWRLPLLIIHGGDDRLVAPETSRAFFERVAVSDKTRIEYEGYCHETHNDTGWERPVGDVVSWLAARV